MLFSDLKRGTPSPRQNQKLLDTKTYPDLPVSVGASTAPKEQESPAALSAQLVRRLLSSLLCFSVLTGHLTDSECNQKHVSKKGSLADRKRSSSRSRRKGDEAQSSGYHSEGKRCSFISNINSSFCIFLRPSVRTCICLLVSYVFVCILSCLCYVCVWGVLVEAFLFCWGFSVLFLLFKVCMKMLQAGLLDKSEVIFVSFAVSVNCRRNLEGETSPQNCPQTIQQHQQAEGI